VLSSLKKTSPKYWNRLFHNNGEGTFTDVTEKAGLAGSGYDDAIVLYAGPYLLLTLQLGVVIYSALPTS